MSKRHEIGGRIGVLVGASWSGTLHASQTDVVDFWSYTGSGTSRHLMDSGVLDALRCHYSSFDIALGPSGSIPISVLLLQVAPPGQDGHYSLPVAHENLVPLVDSARVVIAEVADRACRTYESRPLLEEDIDIAVNVSLPLLKAPGTRHRRCGGRYRKACCSQDSQWYDPTIGNGRHAGVDTCTARGTQRDLGIHSGAIVDGVADPMERGVITNVRKTRDASVAIAGLMMRSRRIHDFSHLRPEIQFRPTSYVHSASVLASIDRLVGINSVIEVDLSGQINAEVAGGRYLGGVGGAGDFIRGASPSNRGFSIIVLPSRSGGKGRIVVKVSGPVSTSRSDAQLIVTEFGVANLQGTTLSERMK